MQVHIRPETKDDIRKIWRINAAAFDTEAEANLVDNLRKRRIVVIEFPDLQKAQDFYNSADYADAKKIREGAALAQFVAIEGVA